MFPRVDRRRYFFQRFCSILMLLFLCAIFLMRSDNKEILITDDILSQLFYAGTLIFFTPNLTLLFYRIIIFIEECFYWKEKWRDHLHLCFGNCYMSIFISALFLIFSCVCSHTSTFCEEFHVCLFDYDEYVINKTFDDEKSIGWSWAYGAYRYYYNICFEGILQRMENFEQEHKIKLFVKRLVIICPLSCNIDGLLSGRDPAICLVGRLESVFNDQGGNVNRDYHNSVYKIGDSNPIYAAVEFPNSLKCFKKEGDEQMSEEMRKYHRDCFIKHLKRFLEDKPCIFLLYDDENPTKSLSEFLEHELYMFVKDSKFSKFIAISEKDI
ncbi:stimulator of interferon genes protein-like [Stegodyphus dumicola]|uniref:stimulator of interferon genes protein-like n=1 Tax=Stegodyphus dumicola TaxID=202533 RepID=UPI0015AC43A1|nr:stimulator of interferon genes protein-like [Stegodyphus dumicola]